MNRTLDDILGACIQFLVSHCIRLSICALLALAPFVLISLWVEYTRNPRIPVGNEADLMADFACVALGASCVLLLPGRWLFRIPAAIVSMPFFFFATAYWWFMYEMATTGIWV